MFDHSERVLIVASGPTVQRRHLAAAAEATNIHIVAVNGALDHMPRCDSWFTLDPSPRNVEIMQRPRAGVRYYAAPPPGAQLPSGVKVLRRIAGDGVLSAKNGLSEVTTGVHTGNSAYGALGLAFHMKPERIAFLGLDGRPGAYFYGGGGPSGRLDHLPALFASAIPQLRGRGVAVVNGSPNSAILCFPRTTPEEALRWLQS